MRISQLHTKIRLLVLLLVTVGLSPSYTNAKALTSIEEYLEASNGDIDRFESIILEQRKLGAPTPLIIDAEFYLFIATKKNSRAAIMADEVENLLNQDTPPDHPIFEVGRNSTLSIIEVLRAHDAYSRKDYKAFEKHAKTAFWLSPEIPMQLELSQTIAEYHETILMADYRFPMDTTIYYSDGNTTTLKKLAEGKKAVLLDFWASWFRPCISLRYSLQHKAEVLKPQGIVVAVMNTEDIATAEAIRTENDMTLTWLVEPEGRVFSQLLNIDSIPRMILISPEGKILFNGHPQDDTLGYALANIGASLQP